MYYRCLLICTNKENNAQYKEYTNTVYQIHSHTENTLIVRLPCFLLTYIIDFLSHLHCINIPLCPVWLSSDRDILLESI